MPRLRILSKSEIDEFENPPLFDSHDRKKHFAFPPRLLELAEDMRKPANKVRFLVLAGYFKAARKFFGARFHERDLRYVASQVDCPWESVASRQYSKNTLSRHQRIVLDYYGFERLSGRTAVPLAEEIAETLRSEMSPKNIFFHCLEYLEGRRVAAPSYDFLSKLVIERISSHRDRLARLVDSSLPEAARIILDGFLEKEDPRRLGLTILKDLSLSNRFKHIKRNVELLRRLRGAYLQLEPTLRLLSLTDEGLRHYAGYVLRARSFQVARRDKDSRYLYLMAFVAHQYFKTQDLLVDIFLHVTQSARNAARSAHKEECYERRLERSRSVLELSRGVEAFMDGAVHKMEAILSSTMTDSEKVAAMRGLFEAHAEDKRRLEELVRSTDAEFDERDTLYYQLLEKGHRKLLNKCGGIMEELEFHFESRGSGLEMALEWFRDGRRSIPPPEFLDAGERAILRGGDGGFRAPLAKTLLAFKMADALKSGAASVRHTFKYRPLDDYLIPKEEWRERRGRLVRQAGLEDFEDKEKVVDELRTLLDRDYRTTNENILSGANKFIRLKEKGFTLATPSGRAEEGEDDILLGDYFPGDKTIPLLEVLSTVDSLASFSEEFSHVGGRRDRARPSKAAFLAAVIGYGCGIDTGKIGQVSRNLSQIEIDKAVNWYFSNEHAINANDRLLKFCGGLSLPGIYREDSMFGVHTASDGQKFEVGADTVHATRSYKYFGNSKGVSAYSFIDDRHFLYHSTVISANERESAYVVDGLMRNDVVESDLHSTDTHGFSEFVSGILHMILISFAPRIKNLKSQRLFSFGKGAEYRKLGYPILPGGNMNTDVIFDKWEDMLRLAVTIKLKRATASDLFRRLNSYSKQHELYRAVKAFGQIIKSRFILRYIDNPDLRMAIEKILNKIENSHKLTRAIDIGDFSGLEDKADMKVAESCRRLIKNAIICWNYLYVTNLLAKESDRKSRQKILNAVRSGSIVAWRHINFHGEYDFSQEKLQDTIGFDVPKILGYSIG
jgi:TnpA family transposase